MHATTKRANRFNRLWIKLSLVGVVAFIGAVLAIILISTLNALPPLPPPPRLVSVLNGAEPDELVGYRFKPYSWMRQLYTTNPRGYLHTRSAGDLLLDGWNFDGLKEATLIATPSETTFPLTISVEALKADLPTWATYARHSEVIYKANSAAKIDIEISSTTPRKIDVFFWPPGDWDQPFFFAPLEVGPTAKEYALKLPGTKSDIKLVPGINLGGHSGDIVIKKISLEGLESPTPLKGENYYVDYFANKYGFRGPDWPMECPAGVTRIACLGDSFTFGQGVKYEDLFSQRVESKLNQTKRENKQRYETMNFGMMGYSTQEEAELLRSRAMTFSPRIVVLTMCWNDCISFKRDMELHDTHKDPNKYKEAVFNIAKEEGFKFCIDHISDINAQCMENECQLIVGIFNVSKDSQWDHIVAEVIPAMQKQGIPAFDIKQELLEADCYELNGIVNSSDFHPNEKAHAIYAKKLAEVLEKEVLPKLKTERN